jgi:hypothetical protein
MKSNPRRSHVTRVRRASALAALLLALTTCPNRAVAQFLFLDTNGDGVYSRNESLPFDEGPATIDVYLITNRGYAQTPVMCSGDPSQEPGPSSYTINLYSIGSSVTFTSIQNLMPGMFEAFPPVVQPYALSVSYAGPQTLPPGKYHLLRMTATFHARAEGTCPTLVFVPSSCFSPPGVVTSFGAGCPGLRGDDVYRYGEELIDAGDIVTCTDLTNRPPSITCPATVEGREGEPMSFSVSVLDGDCSPYYPYYFYSTLPGGAVFSGLEPAGAYVAQGTVSWTPSIGQAGTHPAKFDAYENIYGLGTYTAHRECTTQITVQPAIRVLPTRVFTTPENETTKLPRGKPSTCFRIEALPGDPFALEDIDPASLSLRYQHPTCGELVAGPMAVRSFRIGDTDQNGLPEYDACFSSQSLEALVACDPPGRRTLSLELSGSLSNGDRIQGSFSHTFITGHGPPTATISPNPLSPRSAIEFTTTQTGFAKAMLFDIHGRLVATLVDEAALPTGDHRIPFAGYEALSRRLASGIYFVRLATEHDGSETRAVTILK